MIMIDPGHSNNNMLYITYTLKYFKIIFYVYDNLGSKTKNYNVPILYVYIYAKCELLYK